MAFRPSSQTRRLRVLAGVLVPLIGFVVVLQLVGNATEALAITDAIPILWVLAYAARHRRIEPVGAAAVVVSVTALLLTIALGGSPLPLELHRAVFPGAVGLVCLISLAAHRPLLATVSSRLAKSRPEAAAQAGRTLEAPHAHAALTTLTAIIGVSLLADAASQVVLALTVSASTFGTVARLASRVIIGVGLAICVLYLRRLRTRLRREGVGAPTASRPNGRTVADALVPPDPHR